MYQDAYSTPPLEQDAALGAGGKGAMPEVGFFDQVRLGLKQGGVQPDWGLNDLNHEARTLRELYAGLEKKGWRPPAIMLPIRDIHADESLPTANIRMAVEAMQHIRRADPNFMPEFASVVDVASFHALSDQRRKDALAAINQEAPDGLGFGGFVGQLGHGLTDPTSFIPVGKANQALSFGRQLLSTAIREGVANVAITAATEPLVRQHSERMGIERTAGDFLTDLSVAGVTGAAIGGAFEAGHTGVNALVDVATPLHRKVARELRQAEVPGAPPLGMMDIDVALAFARAVPPESRTPEQQAALNVIGRDAEIEAQSPFVAGPEGDTAHTRWLDLAMGTVAGETNPRPRQKAVSREAVAAGTADPSTLRNPPRETLKAKIRRAEATAGNDHNELSGATGPYQFVARTWVSLFKRRYPNDPRSFGEIAALRRDPHLNEVLMDDLVAENAAALKVAGLRETAGNLYLAHFLGHDRAVSVLRAHHTMTIGELLPAEYFHDNPWLKRDWTTAQLSGWADRKMGMPVERLAQNEIQAKLENEAIERLYPETPDVDIPAGRYDVEAMLGISGEGADRPILRPELFDSPEDHAAAQRRFEADRDAAEGFAAVRSADELFDVPEHFPALRAHAATGGKLTPEAIGEALGIRPDQARRVATSLALQPDSPIMVSRGRAPGLNADGSVKRAGVEPGGFIRRPRPPKPGPQSLIDFLSQRGIDDAGGELRMLGADRWHREGPFRRKLIREGGMAYDEALAAAIEAGYFPEYNKLRLTDGEASYADLPDLDVLFDAIDAEMRGRRLFVPEDQPEVFQRARELGDHDPEFIDRVETLANERGVAVDEDLLDDVAAKLGPLDFDEAFDEALVDQANRAFATARHETGDAYYVIDEDGSRFDVDFEPGDGGAAGREAGGGGGRPEGVAGDEASRRAFAAQSADRPAAAGEAGSGGFDDPVGPAAANQADSVIHDLRMQDRPGDDAADQMQMADTETYRLDDEGDETDLKSILDENEAARKSAAEMRACLKPPKGGGE